ncbi:hypothetical protein F0562_000998 [Nyssa sinensis]|uniref:PWI domain-containing protein n=1 Tax=Nyssa sinensis TaxID=561372 RepID=A0A5J5C3D7_9ASTE|nr:hypothetical protein F0562_000998 [Nyssa sinensis]
MSGGFFRGTSADQDTRFSNKQAKLLKSQKFAPELEHLVDMTKVKMDVMRPWIANRVTELLGFEDEVLINFIYGLLDAKEVNGKEVQISLTGFMEKNTGKFMKELWTLLLSAQKNASGVPQQLLDAKEEETRKKKEETDRIANEIQKKREKEGRELEQEKLRKMDGELDISRANNAGSERNSKHQTRASSAHPADEKETNERNGSRGRSRMSRSPRSAHHSPSSPRRIPSRSISKSFSNSQSYSDERHKPRCLSGSPQPRGHSISSERVYRSPLKRSVTPRRRHSPPRSLSPSRRRSSHSRRRSTSRSHHRSPSPVRRRLHSPLRRRSRSPPMRHRSRSPMRHRSRSPMRHRSRSPIRRRSRSPVRRRSRSPVRHWSRSPMRRRSPSPVWRRSPPVRRRSPSPIRRRYRRSPSTPQRRFPSPIRRRSPIPGRRRSLTPPHNKSSSSQERSSPSPIRHMPPSPIRRKSPMRKRSPVQSSPRERIKAREKFSPARHAPPREKIEHPVEIRKGPDTGGTSASCFFKSPSLSESPPGARKRSPSKDRRSYSSYESPVKQIRGEMIRGSSPSPPRKSREHKPRHDSPETSGEEEETISAREHRDQKPKSSEKRSMPSSTANERKDSLEKVHYKDEYIPERLAGRQTSEVRGRL